MTIIDSNVIIILYKQLLLRVSKYKLKIYNKQIPLFSGGENGESKTNNIFCQLCYI